MRRRTDRGEKQRRRPDRESRPAEVEEQTETQILKGRHPVATALQEGRPINKVMIAEGSTDGMQPIIARAKERGVVVQFVPRTRLDTIAGSTHQGVAAYVAPYAYAELEDIVARETGHAPLIVVLDGVTDPHNLGAIVRTAEAAGAQGVVIGRHRAAPLTETVAKAAAGALEYLPIARVANITQALDELKEAGYWVVGTALDADNRMVDVDYKQKTVIVIGSEGVGMHRLVKEHCDFLVTIPILGRVQSLNASVAAGVMLYEVVRQRT
ncbi:23S rRNA (guanosine(2251)-2'-O)-methyltransferase RlmB [Alicyclobacillus dauci]|uniref:23S rRNA (Guanosine(2251)-2'-O)-methyltransferase RlmB n=1 Tax=Alicyclobacillus dauci TaxID=1475485 RepID=A0ABY6Z3P7_9BACL|nr:23S rRNA (guanosine(2251)-2'-O)-methyltransferase RlmB [Alicyclobacillus dauci]WAH37374.1 23S rRNA (guanosine(2251)-2'-O)-methyltransferase RlmB [Alicyclobacillus dauci]